MIIVLYLSITCSSSSGRQLLVDFRQLRDWLLSPGELSLPQSVLESLSNIPAIGEIERGLLKICGTTPEDTRLDSEMASPIWGELWRDLPFASHLQLCWIDAWTSDKDWTDCSL